MDGPALKLFCDRLRMTLGDRLNAILSRWQGDEIHRRATSLPVWDLGRPGFFSRQRRDAVAACRRELLTALLNCERPIYLAPPEPPHEYKIPGDWQPAGKTTWLVPADFDPDHPAVRHWLFALGDWRLYQAAGPVEAKSPDVFRCDAAELLAWMNDQAVEALIESFHDDTDWVVAHLTVCDSFAPR